MATDTTLHVGDRVIHRPTGHAGSIMLLSNLSAFVNFGTKANPFDWVELRELAYLGRQDECVRNSHAELIDVLREALLPFAGFTSGNPPWVARALHILAKAEEL